MLTAEKKLEIFKEHGKSEVNTGLSESQVALFSYRINHLTQHLKGNGYQEIQAYRKILKFKKVILKRQFFGLPFFFKSSIMGFHRLMISGSENSRIT